MLTVKNFPLISRKFILVAIFAFIYIIANFDLNQEKVPCTKFIAKNLPLNINGAKGQNITFKETSGIFDIMSPDDFVLRIYKDSKKTEEINLALILADDKKKIHDPKLCYKLQGFEFINTKFKQLMPGLCPSYIKTIKEGKEYIFMYWYTDLDKNYATRAEFWREIIFKKIFGKTTNTYGIVILYTPVENSKNLEKFAIEVNKILLKSSLN